MLNQSQHLHRLWPHSDSDQHTILRKFQFGLFFRLSNRSLTLFQQML